MELSNLRKFVIAQGFLVLLLVATAFFTATNLDQSLTLTLELTSLQEVFQATEVIGTAMEEERLAIGQYPLTGNDELLTRIADAQSLYDQNWAIIVENQGDLQNMSLADVEEARNTYEGMIAEIISDYQANPDTNNSAQLLSSAINFYLQNLEPKFSALSEPALQSLLSRAEQERTRAANLKIISRAALGLSIIVGIVVVVQVIAALWFSRRMITSIQAIVNAANAISRGDMDVHIDVDQGGEIGDLAEAIDRMRTSLRAAIERLRR
jgi:nitrogen fixation/metabolism regulation signal transduction histidine kinase